MAYGSFEDSPRKTASHKELRDKASNIAKKKKIDIKEVFPQWFITFLIKSSQVLVWKVFEKRKVHSSFIDIISGVLILPTSN